jgi:hypothetical protein
MRRRLLQDIHGNVAIMFALGLPVLAAASMGGMELLSVVSDRQQMQSVSELAALAGAKQLNVDNSSSTAERATNFAKAQLSELRQRWEMDITATVVDNGHGVQVAITGHRSSFFGDLLPPGGWHAATNAVADIAGQTPLCVLGFNEDDANVIALQNSSAISASNCGVQSNGDINVTGGARIQAAAVKAVGTASGAITPTALTDAPAIPDPFANLSIQTPAACTDFNLTVGLTAVYLHPGVHCGVILLALGADLHLEPGEHYFSRGSLILTMNAKLTGDDVVLVFDDTELMQFLGNSQISLTGRKSGPYAGFVLAASRANSSNFQISTDHAHELLGTVYIPNGTLTVSGSGSKVADQSAWTVIVAKDVRLSGSPSLVVNSSYSGSAVPVPMGVGDNRVVLSR